MTAFQNQIPHGFGEGNGKPWVQMPQGQALGIKINNPLRSLTDSIRLYENSEFQLRGPDILRFLIQTVSHTILTPFIKLAWRPQNTQVTFCQALIGCCNVLVAHDFSCNLTSAQSNKTTLKSSCNRNKVVVILKNNQTNKKHNTSVSTWREDPRVWRHRGPR